MRFLLTLLLKISLPFVILGGFAALAFGRAWVIGFFGDMGNLVELHNGLDEEITAQVDDEPPVRIAPHDTRLARPSDGAHRLLAKGSSGVVEDATFEISEGRG